MELTAEWTIAVGGKWPLEFKFKGDDLPSGVTITEIAQTVSPATGLTVSDPVPNSAADGFTFWAEAVTAGGYSALFVATRSDGGKNIVLGHIEVPAASDRTSLAANALITVADFRGYLADEGIPKGIAETIINGISQEFNHSVDCELFNETFTAEALDGNGLSFMYLPHWPVTKMTTLVEDGVTLTEDTDFFVDYDQGIISKPVEGRWTRARGGVVVTYDAGYEAVPADITLACLKQCAWEYTRAKKNEWGETSRSTPGGDSISLVEPGLLPDVLAVLERYWRTRL